MLFLPHMQRGCLLCREHRDATDCLDLALGRLAEELGLDNDGLLGQQTLAQHLEVALKYPPIECHITKT